MAVTIASRYVLEVECKSIYCYPTLQVMLYFVRKRLSNC